MGGAGGVARKWGLGRLLELPAHHPGAVVNWQHGAARPVGFSALRREHGPQAEGLV